MTPKARISALIIATATMVGLGACKSQKKAVSAPEYGQTEQTSMPAGHTLDADFTAMTSAYTPWNDLSVPVKVSVTQPKKVSVSGTLKMEYNKALSLSLKMLFIEVAQVYIDNDSVLVVSRPAGAYYSESLQRFTAASGLCLADIQSLFLGQAFAPGKGTATASDGKVFRLAAEPSLSDAEMSVWKATPRKLPAGVDWNFTAIAPVQAEPAVVPQLFALDISAASNTLRCSYAGSGISQAGIIASMMQIDGNVKKRKIDAVISSSMNSAQWNSGTKITRPSIPRNAKKMSTEQVFNMLNKL